MNKINEKMTFPELQNYIHQQNIGAGWWHDLETGEPKERNIGELLCLVHSEISEAMEGVRKDLMDDHLPERPMLEVELADAIDLEYWTNIGALVITLDIIGAIVEKVIYNFN